MNTLTISASIILFISLWMIGRKQRSGFIFSLIGEVMWTYEGIQRGMYDLAAVCIVFAVMAVLNWHRWGKDERQEKVVQ